MGSERAPKTKEAAPRRPAAKQSTKPDAALGTAPAVTRQVPQGGNPVIRALSTERGVPLQNAEDWSQRVGADVAHARLVTGVRAAEAAAALGTRAFTVGNRVFFASGHDAKTDEGRLLAHELVHVAQQRHAEPPASWEELPIVRGNDADEQAARRGQPGHAPAATQMAIACWGDGSSVEALAYLETLGYLGMTLRSIFGNEPADPSYDIPAELDAVGRGPFGKYVTKIWSFRRSIKAQVCDESDGWIKARLAEWIAPESLPAIIDRARALDWEQPDKDKPPVKTNKGSNRSSETTVGIEIANAVVRHYFDSIERMFPRVASITVQKNPVLETPQHLIDWNDVKEDEVPVSHPMDLVTRKALLAADGSSEAHEVYMQAIQDQVVPYGPMAVPQYTAPTMIALVPEPGLWHWAEAWPGTNTVEQVATVLFGAPEQAYRLIPLPPLFGFRDDDIKAFTPENQQAYANKGDLIRQGPDPALLPVADIDPVTELVRARDLQSSVKRFAQTAEAKKPGDTAKTDVHDEANVIDLEKSMIANLDDLAKVVVLFRRSTDALDDARARFQVRKQDATDQCIPDVETQYAFAEKQHSLLGRISLGIGDAGTRLVSNGGAVAPDSVREPLGELVDAYLAALAAIEIPELADQRAGQADRLATNIDIALQEASLHERLGELEGEIAENQRKPDPLVDPSKHERKMEDYAMQLADARIAMRTDPVGTQKKLQELGPQVDELGFDIGLAEKLARLNMLWAAIDGEEDLWEGLKDYTDGLKIKQQNRALYIRFLLEVYLPFQAAKLANDPKRKLAAQKAYSDILRGGQMQEHVDTVKKFLAIVAKHKKWAKLIVSLAIAFVAFGLGQWEFGAVLAAEGTLFEAAVAAGVVTTTTSVVLNKVILDQNPTLVGVLTSFVANVGTFFVVGRIALAAKAAGVEGALAGGEAATQVGTTAAADAASAAATGTASTASKVVGAVGKFSWKLTKEVAVAEALGWAQAQVEKLASEHRFLNWEETKDVAFQGLISVIGMRVFSAVTPSDLFQYKSPEQKLATEINWLKNEQKLLSARGKEIADAAEANPLGKPDEAGIKDLLDRWKTYLEREQAAREKLLEYAERHPGKFTAADLAKLKASQADPAAVRSIREMKALLAIQPEGINRFSCAAGALDTVIAQHQAVGNEIAKIETDPETGQRTITIKPADNSPAFQVTERVPPKGMRTAAKIPNSTARQFEAWLDARDQPNASVEGQQELRDLYARDPAAAINFASEKYGYEGGSVLEPEPVVRPDAPGEAGKLPIEPSVSASDHAVAVQIGHGVVAIGEGRFLASPAEMRGMRKTWARQKGSNPSEIHYDPETNTSHFEMEVGGKRVRVEAQLAPRVESFADLPKVQNRVIGGRVSQAMGDEILRSVANGQPEMLKASGIRGEVTPLGPSIEIGLGKIDGGYVIIVGEPSAVDWSALPGIEPAGHTHPLHPGNDLLPDIQGNKQAPVSEVTGVHPDPHVNRELIFPSAQDFVVMADLGVRGHKIYTGFVVENGVIRKPIAGETRPGIEFTIGESKQIGLNEKGQRVFEATVEGKAGTETPISERKIWIVEEKPGGAGNLYMTEPPGVVAAPGAPPAPAGKTTGALTPAMRKLAGKYGDKAVHWALDSLPTKDIAPLLEIDPTVLDRLMDIPAADARDLIRDVGEGRVKRALGGKSPVTATDLVVLRSRLGTPEAVAMLDAAGTNAVSLERLANRAKLEAAEVLGKPIDKAKLEALGYSVDKNNIIYRKEGQTATMEPLQLVGDKVTIADYVSAAEIQARIYEGLELTKQKAFDAMEQGASANQKVRLVEGVHDTGVTWDQVFGTGGARRTRIQELTNLLTRSRDKGGAGLAPAEAARLVNGLLGSKETLKVVIGTDPVRTAYKYRKGIPEGDIAHHFDPLYLGGGHELIAALPAEAHDAVHAFFDELRLPSSANPSGVRLQPNELQASVRDTAKPAVVIVDSSNGKVTYRLYNQDWKL